MLGALAEGVRPVVPGDRGSGRAGRIEWWRARGVDDVPRVRRGARITEPGAGAGSSGRRGCGRAGSPGMSACAPAPTTIALAHAWLDDHRDFPPNALPAPKAA